MGGGGGAQLGKTSTPDGGLQCTDGGLQCLSFISYPCTVHILLANIFSANVVCYYVKGRIRKFQAVFVNYYKLIKILDLILFISMNNYRITIIFQ